MIFSVLLFLSVFMNISSKYFNNSPLNDDLNQGETEFNDLKPPIKSGYYTPGKISIDDRDIGNTDWATINASNPWCTGKGTYAEPYIIEDVLINAGGSGSGIYIGFSNVYFIIKNSTVYNSGSAGNGAGIYIETVTNGKIIGNNCSNNGGYGILVWTSDNNTVIGNLIENNGNDGLGLLDFSYNNTILHNIIQNNENGIVIGSYCDGNSIINNTINENKKNGVLLDGWEVGPIGPIVDTIISGNILNYNNWSGISYTYSQNSIISDNYINYNGVHGIHLYRWCEFNNITKNEVNNNNQSGIVLEGFSGDVFNNSVTENIINNNTLYGIVLVVHSDYTSITGNFVYYNGDGGISINSANCNDTIITQNVIVSSDENFNYDAGTNTQHTWNYFLPTPPSLNVKTPFQSFSKEEFVITLNIQSSIGFDIRLESLQIWWNGSNITQDKINDLGNGLYNISLTPVLVQPQDPPILLNISVESATHSTEYLELFITVDLEYLEDNVELLNLEIVNQIFTMEEFNITLLIYNKTGYQVSDAVIQIWWNSNDVSADIKNLGNGYYFISLIPITVLPEEDPILLNITIFASGYQDKYFETYLAVDPDILDKDDVKDLAEFPIFGIIVGIVSTLGGLGVATVIIVLLRKRNQ